MKKSPSSINLQKSVKKYETPFELTTNESRKVFDSFFHKCCNPDDIYMSTANFENMSERYNRMPTLNNLFGMAFFAMPISKSVAIEYCKMVLKDYSPHTGAKKMLEELD